MWKYLTAAAATILVAGSTFVFAQQGPSDPAQRRSFRFNTEDAQAFADARIAALKAGLRLTPDQEKMWPAVEAAIRDLAKQRIDRMASRRDRFERGAERPDNAPRPDALDLLRRRADALSTRGASLKKLADAAEPLYKSLDDGQKHRLRFLARGLNARAEAGDRPRWRGHFRDHFRDHFRGERPDRP